MIELRNEAQRKSYIRKLCNKLFGVKLNTITDEYMGVGVLNYVYRVEAKGKIIYIKQALEEAKHKDRIGKDLAAIPKERIQYEEKYIEILRPMLPPQIELPQILGYDKDNNILVLADVKKGGILLEESLLNGNFNLHTAYFLGKFLGISHQKTIGKKIIVRSSEEEDIRNWYILLNMRTTGILEKTHFPSEVEKEIKELYELAKLKYTIPVLMNLDCVPKNVFERKDNSIGLYDFELACGVGDPAYDVGFLLGHYLIMGIIRNDKLINAINAIREILRGYDEEMKSKDMHHNQRVIKYSGIIPLYRIASSSPAPYIKVHLDAVPILKEVAFAWITSDFSNINDALNFLKKILKQKH